MFFPQRMKKVDVVILKSDADAVSKEVVHFGDFQVIEIEGEKAKKQLLNKIPVEDILAKLSEYDRRTNFLITNFDGYSFIAELGQENTADKGEILPESQLESRIHDIENELLDYNQEMEVIQRRKNDIWIKIKKQNLFAGMGLDLSILKDMKHLFAGFGIIPATSLEGFNSAMATLPSMTHKVDVIGQDVLVFFAVPVSSKEKVEGILKNVYFRDYGLPFEIDKNAKNKMVRYAFDLSSALDEELWLEKKFMKLKQKNQPILKETKKSVQYYLSMGKLKGEMAATGKIFLFSGWVPAKLVSKLKASIESLTKNRSVFLEQSADEAIDKEGLTPPTKFNNPAIFRPFEFLVATFGIPNYREIDPTPLMAIGYVFMYGAMFGDVGQGIVLALLGLMVILVKKLKSLRNFGYIIFYVGLSSMFFGFLYGEVFGKAGIVKPYWLSPGHNIMQILATAIVFGTMMISISLLLSIINSVRERNWGRLLFATTGIPGLSFYWSVLYIAFSAITGKPYPQWLVIIPIVALVIIALEKRLEWMLHKGHGHDGEHEEKPGIALGLVEVFEAIIAFASKTVSFVRVGAFALNHSALMGVVFLLAGDPNASPVGHWITLLIGNIFVIGFEGFIVGIQAMRLEFYEFFVAFYRANGRQFDGLGIYKTNN